MGLTILPYHGVRAVHPAVNPKGRKDRTVKEAIGDTVGDSALKFVKRRHRGAINLEVRGRQGF